MMPRKVRLLTLRAPGWMGHVPVSALNRIFKHADSRGNVNEGRLPENQNADMKDIVAESSLYLPSFRTGWRI